MSKAPFERVFSLIERKKLLGRVAKDQAKIILRSSKNEVTEFRVSHIDNPGNLTGQVIGKLPRDYEKVTALFYIDSDRYVLITRIKRNGDQWMLLNDAQFYKFNRRRAFRVKIPVGVELTFHVQTVRNIEINREVSVIEFSSTGARLHWYSDKKLSKSSLIKGVFQWGKGKVLPVEGLVMHSPEPGVYGIHFVNLNAVTSNRLKMLSVEIQQEIQFHRS